MKKNARTKKQPIPDRPRLRSYRLLPLVVLVLGFLSIAMLIGTNRISERQLINFVIADALMDMQILTATSHLWLEESLSGDAGVDIESIWADLKSAAELCEAILKGGKTEHGLVLKPLKKPQLRRRAERAKALLNEFKLVALKRHQGRNIIADSDLDQRLDAIFREFGDEVSGLEKIVEENQLHIRNQSRRLFVGIFLSWALILGAFILGLWKHESRRLKMEEALRSTNSRLNSKTEELRRHREHLRELVDERTIELTNTNKQLQAEIAERKSAEEGIRLYEEVIKKMPIGLNVWQAGNNEDAESYRLVNTNPAAVQSLGFKSEDILGKTMAEIFPGVIKSEIPHHIREVASTGKMKDLGEIRYGDEHIPEGIFNVKAFRLPRKCVAVLFENVTERKKMNAALSESKKSFQKLLTEFNTLAQAISDPLVLFSPDLKVLWTNDVPGPCSADGDSVAKGLKCHSTSLDPTQGCEGCPAASSFVSGLEETSQSMTSDGKIWEVKAYPVKNEDSQITGVLTVAIDVTKRVKLQAETMRVAHLASLGELAAGVAHEINNPINGVINYTQVLIDECKKANADSNIQNRILKEGRRIAGIVKSLLSFAREYKQAREYIGIHEILTDTLDLSEAQLKKDGIILEVNLSKKIPQIMVHPQQIQQVFLNLINNARYALKQKIAERNEDKILTISGEAVIKNDSRYVKITFFDRGTGIPADIIYKIVNPFFSTKPKGVGTGLGLSISHGIITEHGGELIIDSIEGDYTKIDILLPAGTNHE